MFFSKLKTSQIVSGFYTEALKTILNTLNYHQNGQKLLYMEIFFYLSNMTGTWTEVCNEGSLSIDGIKIFRLKNSEQKILIWIITYLQANIEQTQIDLRNI